MLLLTDGKVTQKMEQMIDLADLLHIKLELGMNKQATYDTTLATLFYAKRSKKEKILAAISPATRMFSRLALGRGGR